MSVFMLGVEIKGAREEMSGLFCLLAGTGALTFTCMLCPYARDS